ncbi:MAG: alpha/beta fold hydrolase [Nitriliruptoraceae bacterium]
MTVRRVAGALSAGLAAGVGLERLLSRGRLAPTGTPRAQTLQTGARRTIAGPDGTRLALETFGVGNAPTVLLVHGWLCHSVVWDAQVEALAGHLELVTVDLPGHGRSTAPVSGTWSLDVLGDAVHAALAATPSDGRVVVVGHSLGGMAVLNAARRHHDFADRIASVVLVATASSTRGNARMDMGGLFGLRGLARTRRLLTAVARRVTADPDRRMPLPANDVVRLLIRAAGLGPSADGDVVAFAQQMLSSARLDTAVSLAPAIAALDEDAGLVALADAGVPVSVLAGRRDRIIRRSQAARMIDLGAESALELSGVGHLVPLEATAAVNDVLERHARAVTATGSALSRGRPSRRGRRRGKR